MWKRYKQCHNQGTKNFSAERNIFLIKRKSGKNLINYVFFNEKIFFKNFLVQKQQKKEENKGKNF